MSATKTPWRKPVLAPVVLVSGSETFFSDRAVAKLCAAAEKKLGADIHRIDASSYEKGQLAMLLSPSLFSSSSVLVVRDAHKCSDDFITDAIDYITHPDPESVLIVVHGGGNRGKKLLTAIKKSDDARLIECTPLKKDSDKAAFVVAQFREQKRRIDEEAVRALMDALGGDVREMAGACAQLASDCPGTEPISVADVDRYYGGRVEATGFRVADAVVARDTDMALAMVRQAVGSGLDPVPIVAALAMRIRTLIKVAGFQGSPGAAAKELGMAPWQVDRARREVRRWTAGELANAVVVLADADEMVKGGSKDPVYAVESTVLAITGALAPKR